MIQTRWISGCAASVAAALILLGTGVAPASAQQDPGRPVTAPTASRSCVLERIGTQLVRCDDLTGAGARASSFIPEQ